MKSIMYALISLFCICVLCPCVPQSASAAFYEQDPSSIFIASTIDDVEIAPTETTSSQGWYESQYEIIIDSLPNELSYYKNEPLDLYGLEVSLILYDQHGYINYVFTSVSPLDYPDVFVVDTSNFDEKAVGTYTLKISCTDEYQAFLPTDTITFDVDVIEETVVETTISTDAATTTTTSTDTTTTTDTSTFTTSTDITTTTDTSTSTTKITTTAATHIASDEELCDWTVKDYEEKTGVTPANAEIEYIEEGTAVITLTDAEGNVLDVYTIDPTTGTGTASDGEEVNLPQTGYSKWYHTAAALAACMIGIGGAMMVGSGIKKKRR